MKLTNIKISDGAKLRYEAADFNACDEYVFTINKYADSLKFHYQLVGCSDNGIIETHEKALKESTTLIPFSQGGYSFKSKETEGDDCPIFLISKKQYNDLLNLKQSMIKLTQFEGEMFKSMPVEFVNILQMPIVINGNELLVDAIHAIVKGKDEYEKDNLWILNNPEFPMVLKIETDFTCGDNYWELKEIILNN